MPKTPGRFLVTAMSSPRLSYKKNGEQILSRSGKPLHEVAIQVDKYPDRWFSSKFLPFAPDNWVGQEKDLVLSIDQYGGKFELPPLPPMPPRAPIASGSGQGYGYATPLLPQPAQQPPRPIEEPGKLNLKMEIVHNDIRRVIEKLDKVIGHLSDVAPLNLTSAGTRVPTFDPVEPEEEEGYPTPPGW